MQIRQQGLQFAAQQAAVAGAQEPSAPDRCDAAQAAFDVSFRRPAPPIKCTALGGNFTVQATYDVAIISPFHSGRFWTIETTQTAVRHASSSSGTVASMP